MSYDALLKPGRIGPLTLRNRIVMSAMGSDLSGEGGIASDRMRAFYAARAAGGCGLIVTEAVPVAFPSGFSRPHAMALNTPEQQRAAAALVRAVQSHGAKIALQLNHHGPMARRDMLAGKALLMPSPPAPSGPSGMEQVWLPAERQARAALNAAMPPVGFHVLTPGEIAGLVERFAAAARAAREIGADGIEIHAGHGFLLSAFLSPRSNRREDAYGGSPRNRARFLTEILTAIRADLGPDFPLWCKIDAAERLVEGGITPDLARETLVLLQAAGASAASLSVAADPMQATSLTESNIPHRPGDMIREVRKIGRVEGLPYISAGRLDFAAAARAIEEATVDFVGFGRKLLADPDLARKLEAGTPARVRPCMYCYACISQLSFDRPVKCAANPETGHEEDRRPQPAARPRHVAVVGGGPGGLEATRRLRLAGHRVTLLEAKRRLGGTMRQAALAYPPNEALLNWLIREVEASGAEIRLAEAATPAGLRALAPDLVVLAIGAQRRRPDYPGSEQPHVLSALDMLAMIEGRGRGATGFLLRGAAALGLTGRIGLLRALSKLWMPFGRRITIIGAGLVGLELADFLAHRGRKVLVLDTAPVAGEGLQPIRRAQALQDIKDLGVEVETGVQDLRITRRAVDYTRQDGQSARHDSDQVILAGGAEPSPDVAALLRGQGFAVEEIGDCRKIGYIEGAIEDAADLLTRLALAG